MNTPEITPFTVVAIIGAIVLIVIIIIIFWGMVYFARLAEDMDATNEPDCGNDCLYFTEEDNVLFR